MYRRPKFLEKLLEVRRTMALEADYDVIAFAHMARTGSSRAFARNQPVTRVVTEDESKTLKLTRAKVKKRIPVKK
jgi:hypothetical protein